MNLVMDSEQIMSVVRDRLHGRDLGLLAIRTGCSKSALSAIRNGRTRWPRDYTLFALTVVLGIQIYVTVKETI